MSKIRVGIVGVGNCASSLVQGIAYYSNQDNSSAGLMHERGGDYGPDDVEFVLAIDTDARKVGQDLSAAIFAQPNCTTVFAPDVPPSGTVVKMGKIFDGMADHMLDTGSERGFVRSDEPEADKEQIVAALKEARVEVMVNFLPAGSAGATRWEERRVGKEGRS